MTTDNRKWLPADYQDEVTPPPRASVNDWITTLPGDVFALAPADLIEDDTAPQFTVLHDGDIVKFDWTEGHGRAEFIIHPDGTWSCSVPEPAVPDGGYLNVAVLGDWETTMPSLKEFAKALLEVDAAPRTETIVFYTWSSRPVPHEFRGGQFLPLATA